MNCREAQSQVFAERDHPLDAAARAALDGHLSACEGCRRMRENFLAALTSWRTGVSHTPLPDPEREWLAVRRRIRGGDEASVTRSTRSRRNLFAWLAVPLGAAAAAAVALMVLAPGTGSPPPAGQIARANSVEVAADNATTVFVVDDKSGWLFVWASDPRSG